MLSFENAKDRLTPEIAKECRSETSKLHTSCSLCAGMRLTGSCSWISGLAGRALGSKSSLFLVWGRAAIEMSNCDVAVSLSPAPGSPKCDIRRAGVWPDFLSPNVCRRREGEISTAAPSALDHPGPRSAAMPSGTTNALGPSDGDPL